MPGITCILLNPISFPKDTYYLILYILNIEADDSVGTSGDRGGALGQIKADEGQVRVNIDVNVNVVLEHQRLASRWGADLHSACGSSSRLPPITPRLIQKGFCLMGSIETQNHRA